jgi:3-hydroxyisobutyrate dehydrogenase-like beta-hydroxyacid dehydrogenase
LSKIGFVGVGKTGSCMVAHLLKGGHQVTVYDINTQAVKELQETGAERATSVFELGSSNEIVILMLPHSQVVEEVICGPYGLLTAMEAGNLIVDMSSSYALSTRKMAKELEFKGISLVDAPVSGGVKGAREGSLTIMVGGKEQDVRKVLPILQCMGKLVKHVGEIGSGHALNAINNYLSAASLYATTEAMALAKKLGLNLSVALETINQSSGQSFSTHYKFPTFVLPREFHSGFSLDLLLKDVKMTIAMAKELRVPMLQGEVVERIYELAANNGEPGQDHTEIVMFLEEITKVTIMDEK